MVRRPPINCEIFYWDTDNLKESLELKLEKWMALPCETEVIEFKAAQTDFDFDKLGKYFSAISNEAALRGLADGWLILGVSDGLPRKAVGTKFKNSSVALSNLKNQIASHTTDRLTYIEIHELDDFEGMRVLLFQIPAAPFGTAVSWKGHFYGREGESLVPLGIHKLDKLRSCVLATDWSGQICDTAGLHHLEPEAILFARQQFKHKNQATADEVDSWNDEKFLNKAKICIDGNVTNTALLLLGKAESGYLISPAVAQITWILKGDDGLEKDYQHFGMPFILAPNRLFARIRNLTYRYIPDQGLFPEEVSQYDSWVIREIINNCIAHQDYSKGGRIQLIEEPDSLLFTNLGSFIPGTVEEVISRDAPSAQYRNAYLAQAMVSTNMIDTIGSGIKKVFLTQRNRGFPMPDYDLSSPGSVAVRLYGKVLDEKFTRILMEKGDLNLEDVVALDKVQKGKKLEAHEYKSLRSKKLIEGRKSNPYVSAKIAAITDGKADYIRRKGLDNKHYSELIVAYLSQFTRASRSDIDKLLMEKLPETLSEPQRKNLIKNLLQKMRADGLIEPTGEKRATFWVLSSKSKNA